MTGPARLTLPAAVSRDDIDDAMSELGWLLVNAVAASTQHPAQIVLMTDDRRNLIYVLDDPRLDALSIVVQGSDPEGCAAIVRARFPGASDA